MQNVPVTAPPPPPVVPTPPPPPAPVPVPPVVPPPPPAPLSPPSPPAPSGCQNGSTTITVEVFYNQVIICLLAEAKLGHPAHGGSFMHAAFRVAWQARSDLACIA